MRQPVWEMGHTTATIDWPDGMESPEAACEFLKYQEEYRIGSPDRRPWIALYQHTKIGQVGTYRYLILIQMYAGYEIIVATDFQRLMKAMNEIAPLITQITASVR